MRKLIIYISLVGLLTYISGLIPRRLKGADLAEDTYSICEKYGEDAVVGSGWPFAFIYDGNVTSPVCSAGWTETLLFHDVLLLPNLALTVVLAMSLSALVLFGLPRVKLYRIE